MIVPKGFKKELSFIDPTYRVEQAEDKGGYFIIKDIDLSLKADGGSSLSIPNPKTLRVRGPRIILWVPALEEGALESLRQMKEKGRELRVFDNPLNELAYYQKLKREAIKKKHGLAVDMISEGLMEKHRLERKKSWSYGGSET